MKLKKSVLLFVLLGFSNATTVLADSSTKDAAQVLADSLRDIGLLKIAFYSFLLLVLVRWFLAKVGGRKGGNQGQKTADWFVEKSGIKTKVEKLGSSVVNELLDDLNVNDVIEIKNEIFGNFVISRVSEDQWQLDVKVVDAEKAKTFPPCTRDEIVSLLITLAKS